VRAEGAEGSELMASPQNNCISSEHYRHLVETLQFFGTWHSRDSVVVPCVKPTAALAELGK